MFLDVSVMLMVMAVDDEGRAKAARYTLECMARRGWGVETLAQAGGVDPGTVRDFIYGTRWPQQRSRLAIEKALEISPGGLELIAKGLDDPVGPDADPVKRAIFASRLTLSNAHRLVGIYYGMLEDQERGAERGSA